MTFNILDHLDNLEITKQTRTQIVANCPVCDGGNLKISTKDGKWQCWDYPDDEAHKKAIRDAINPPVNPNAPDGDRPPKRRRPRPAPRPPAPPMPPAATSRWPIPTEKTIRPKGDRVWHYSDRQGNPLIRTRRIDDGTGKRTIWQEYWIGNTAWRKGGQVDDATKDPLKQAIAPFRYHELTKAAAAGELIFWVEGEPCADALAALGFHATTTIGGGGAYGSYGDYSQDFARARIVIVPDRDKNGLKYARAIAADHPDAQWLYPWPDLDWSEASLPRDKGLDIADWLAAGATPDDILGNLEPQRPDTTPRTPDPTPSATTSPDTLSLEDLRREIDRILDASDSEMEMEIPRLAAASDRTEQSIRRLIEATQREREERDRLDRDSLELRSLIDRASKPFDPHGILPDALARAFTTKAQSDRIDPIRLLQNLLPACGVILGGRVQVIAKKGHASQDDWIESPIFWTNDVSPPSSGKSAAQDAIFAPLYAMQDAEDARIEKCEAELEAIAQAWEAMKPQEKAENFESTANPKVFREEMIGNRRTYVLNEGEMEAILKRLADNPPNSGSCWVKDELAGLFSGLDQYKGSGKGNSRQLLLTAWNKPLAIRKEYSDRSGSLRLKGQTLNIAGGLQPKLAAKHFALVDDPDGLLSRFLPARPSLPDNFAEWSDVTVDIYGSIDHLYRQLRRVPNCVLTFSTGAGAIWRRQWERYRRGYLKYQESNPAFAFFLGKQCSYMPRLALWLHCVEWALGDNTTEFPTAIGTDTAERAANLSEFYCGQFLLVQAYSEETEGHPLTGQLFKIYKAAEAKGGQITVRECQRSILRRSNLKAAHVRERFEAICNTIPGCTFADGVLSVPISSSKAIDMIDKTAETPATPDVNPVDRVIDNDRQDRQMIDKSSEKRPKRRRGGSY
ncbi:MAG: DUF3987 domain-containing protein [Cyanobacteria bacterium]|nr:DUF3987 domain-containing protein [Cyanobacteriota bacterium]